jgi:transposase
LELETSLQQVIETLPDPKKPIRVWVEDEVRYGLITVVRRVWGMQGIRVLAPYQAKYQSSYLYGALEITQGEAQMLFRMPVCLENTEVFLQELVATEPDAYHILLWDNAGFHPKAGDETLPETIRLLPFPPYSPELNPVERLWDIVKDGIANRIWETLDDLEEAMVTILEPFLINTERMKQFLGDNWLTQAVAKSLYSLNTS